MKILTFRTPLAQILAEALAKVADAGRAGRTPDSLAAAARDAGHTAARTEATGLEAGLLALLRQCGYEPATTPQGDIELRNCPFHQVAQQHRDLVCGANQHLLCGLLDATGHAQATVRMRPRSDRCCVVIEGLDPPAPV